MANINLLPWREERREQRNKDYHTALVAVALFAGFLLYLVYGYYQDATNAQGIRNAYLEKEAKVLDAKIDEIRTLQDTRKELIERMELIQALQGNRPVIVRIFDELARSVPDDLYFTDLSVKGEQISLSGVAKSNNRVAAVMRNLDRSDWFTNPVLLKVQAESTGVNVFEITMARVNPKQDEEGE
ncbi:PilN domain-containing protein [Bacterioplanoides sp. SCSIO 12839]|uniref:PilN domain-containing protein n=1 Tax=Bacterioplanoides sp. SCSIO 12839 TaxID=2829569 RepID=UPI00210536AB|nr:PilN domain-containing protein [Bacterioplanoides sp. SCSIO 12839]UTW47893.1 PilN domain-containing protein [Bacterioplanoides sp. SCSIO 12839]